MRFDLSSREHSNLLWQYRCDDILITWVRLKCANVPGFGANPIHYHPLVSAYQLLRVRLFIGIECKSNDKKLLLVMFTSLVFL